MEGARFRLAFETDDYWLAADGADLLEKRIAPVGRCLMLGTLLADLNFGGQYPYHVFNAVIFKRKLRSFPEARSWEGKFIKVRGTIKLYKGIGMPEIILERKEQVTIDPFGGAVGGGVLGETDTGPVMDYDSPPQPIKITRPQYPLEAFKQKIEGTVVVEILIDSEGRVEHARIIQSIPLLDAAALQTVYQWVFRPAIKSGRPVPTIAHAPVAFRF